MRDSARFICTFSVAHVLYLVQESAARLGQLPMCPASQPFWDDILDTSANRDKGKDRAVLDFWDRLNVLGQVADAFMSVARQYTAQDGSMSEQIHRWVLPGGLTCRNNRLGVVLLM
jgi:glucoamylase